MTDEQIVKAAKEAGEKTTFGKLVHSPISRGVNSAYGIGFLEGAEWHREQMRVLIEKWQEHAIHGMKVGNVSYFQGRVALCVELLENLKEAGK